MLLESLFGILICFVFWLMIGCLDGASSFSLINNQRFFLIVILILFMTSSGYCALLFLSRDPRDYNLSGGKRHFDLR